MKKVLSLLVAVVALVSLAACVDPAPAEKSATGYGIVHKDYVGFATVKVQDKLVKELSIDEVFLPSSWADIAVTAEESDNILRFEKISHGSAVAAAAAKFIKVGDKTFTGSVRAEDLTIGGVAYTGQVIKYSNTETPDLYMWLRESADNCKWYYDTVVAGNYSMTADDFSTKLPAALEGNYFKHILKSESGYWAEKSDSQKGNWSDNIGWIIDSLLEHELVASPTFAADEETATWSWNDVKSSATMTDFKDYYMVAYDAYKRALA